MLRGGAQGRGIRLEIFETFGLVKNLFYSLSTNSEQGQLIFVLPNNTSYMLTAEFMKCVCVVFVRGVCVCARGVCVCVCVCV